MLSYVWVLVACVVLAYPIFEDEVETITRTLREILNSYKRC